MELAISAMAILAIAAIIMSVALTIRYDAMKAQLTSYKEAIRTMGEQLALAHNKEDVARGQQKELLHLATQHARSSSRVVDLRDPAFEEVLSYDC